MTDDKKCIIDPLTTLCKLAVLYFMPEKTKLGINHYILCIQGYSYFQWWERMTNGDNRKNIANLYIPIVKVIKWYILENEEKIELDAELEKNIRLISSFAIKGLQKLQLVTYNQDMTIKINLQYLINLLKDALNGRWNESNLIHIDGENNILSEKIKRVYDSNIINSIAKMLNDANQIENSPNDIDALVDCVHKLLTNRDNLFVKLMNDFNTTL